MSPTEFAVDLSNVRVRKGDDLDFHFEALRERIEVSDGKCEETC